MPPTEIMYSNHKCERLIDSPHPYVAVTSTRLKGNFIEMVCKCSSVLCLLITAKTVRMHIHIHLDWTHKNTLGKVGDEVGIKMFRKGDHKFMLDQFACVREKKK